ncbi:MAG: hypothetical protein V3T40_05415 [Nitrososphaerales archaeon]
MVNITSKNPRQEKDPSIYEPNDFTTKAVLETRNILDHPKDKALVIARS